MVRVQEGKALSVRAQKNRHGMAREREGKVPMAWHSKGVRGRARHREGGQGCERMGIAR